MPPEIRIWKVVYCGNVGRPRAATVVVKVPYGGAFAMTELLTRMVAIGQVRWFQIAAAKPDEIEYARKWGLERWLPALVATSIKTKVDWQA